MLHTPLCSSEAAEEAAMPYAVIARKIAALAAGLDTRFIEAGSTLASAVAIIDRLLAGLDQLSTALDARTAGASVEDLRQVARDLTALPDVQSARMARTKVVAEITRSLRDHMLDMHRTLRILDIYGMNIKIAASGEEEFVRFVERMRSRLEAGEAELGEVLQRLSQLTDRIADMQQLDRLLATGCARIIPAAPRRLEADAGVLGSHLEAVADLVHGVAIISRGIQAKVAVVLGALQVSDSTRQRMEHVVAIVQMLETRTLDTEDVRHVNGLIAALLHSAAEAFEMKTAALVTSLFQLGPEILSLEQLIATQAGGGGRLLLENVVNGIAEVSDITAQLRGSEVRAHEMTSAIIATAEELTERVGSVTRVRRDVQDIATNTRLLAQRLGANGCAVAVVAAEVGMQARELERAGQTANEALARLGAAAGERSAEPAPPRDMGATLATALSIVRHACQQTEQMGAVGTDDTHRLIGMIETVANDLLDEKQRCSAIATGIATSLSAGSPAGPVMVSTDGRNALRDLLAALSKTYTMAEERIVHDGFLLPGMESLVPPPAADGNDEEDDGLF